MKKNEKCKKTLGARSQNPVCMILLPRTSILQQCWYSVGGGSSCLWANHFCICPPRVFPMTLHNQLCASPHLSQRSGYGSRKSGCDSHPDNRRTPSGDWAAGTTCTPSIPSPFNYNKHLATFLPIIPRSFGCLRSVLA